jgi:hypothetical protein
VVGGWWLVAGGWLSQFKTHFKRGKLATEQIVRLDNGFPTTEDERQEFDRRQEFNMKKVSEAADTLAHWHTHKHRQAGFTTLRRTCVFPTLQYS